MINLALLLVAGLSIVGRLIVTSGFTVIWVMANLSYAGMRAQGSLSWWQRKIAFLLGFPGTLVSAFVVVNGAGRVYGVDLPAQITTRQSFARR
jgi:hypothetical protein